MNLKITVLLAALYLPGLLSAQIKGDDLLGYWITEDDNVVVYCTKVNDMYYAKVVWYGPFQEENLKRMTKKERDNIQFKYLNAVVLKDFTFDKDEWAGGKIVQVFENKTYSAWIEKTSTKELKVTGFLFFRWLSESTTLRRCNKPDGILKPKAI
ncbi:MAG: DUF2147 domain-containing protein [Cytophagales bacterium]|nr:DUF2147 domain-containing protein [Cytophagales bacterium]